MGSIATDLAAFTLTGIPINDAFYQLRAEALGSVTTDQERVVSAEELEGWLLARDCEFCAHQVKLHREVRCSHPPFTAEDLAALGFPLPPLVNAIAATTD